MERRRLDDVVVERPQGVVGEALVELLQVVLGEHHRDQLGAVDVERLELEVGRAGPAHPGAGRARHHGRERGDQPAGGAGPGGFAVVVEAHVHGQPVRDDDEVVAVRGRVGRHEINSSGRRPTLSVLVVPRVAQRAAARAPATVRGWSGSGWSRGRRSADTPSSPPRLGRHGDGVPRGRRRRRRGRAQAAAPAHRLRRRGAGPAAPRGAALQKLRHPGVAAILDAEADSTEAFLVTELVAGDNLEEHVRERGPLDAEELLDLAEGLRDTLVAVHGAGVVHRDLKPSNVIVGDDGPVLIDFGIAQAADDSRLTAEGLVMGTPGYLAPELLDGDEPDDASDFWGWAAVLAFAATGRAPFGSRPLEAVLARARSGEVDLDGLGPLTAAALRGALAPAAADRTAPDDVVAALTLVVAEGEPMADETETTVLVADDVLGTTVLGPEPATVAVAPVGRGRRRAPAPSCPPTTGRRARSTRPRSTSEEGLDASELVHPSSFILLTSPRSRRRCARTRPDTAPAPASTVGSNWPGDRSSISRIAAACDIAGLYIRIRRSAS